MKQFVFEIIKDTLVDYKTRFFIYFGVLYTFTVLSEICRQIFIEQKIILGFASVSSYYFNPFIWGPWSGRIFFSIFGFAVLYYLYTGVTVKKAIIDGFINLPRYILLVLAGGVFFLLFFLGVPLLLSILFYFLGINLPHVFIDDYGLFITLPIIILAVIPGIYLLVSFSVGPFVLFFEKRSVLASLFFSFKLINSNFLRSFIMLTTSFLLSAFVYLFLRWLIFTLKLSLVSDLSFRGESMLRIFIYVIPWVLVSTVFDLIVYRTYKKLSAVSNVDVVNNS